MILYKYRGDNQFTESIFIERRVWLSTPAGLNDPCECTIHPLAEEWVAEAVQKQKSAQLMGFIHSALENIKGKKPFWGLSIKDTLGVLERLKALPDFDSKYTRFRAFIERRNGYPPSNPDEIFPKLYKQLENVGIFSMSEVADNALMWAHYTSDNNNNTHTGLCIGFDIPEEKINHKETNFLKVNYTNDIPKMEGGYIAQTTYYMGENGRLRPESEVSFSDPVLQRAIKTKSPEWSYEREWRFVNPKGGKYAWPGRIVEITFGLRCPIDRRIFYIELAKKHNSNTIRFFEMQKIIGSNALQRMQLVLD